MTAVAQARKVKMEALNQEMSFCAVGFALRASIHHLCYVRGFLPSDCFDDTKLQELEGLSIKMLKNQKGGSKNSKRLIQWIEKGAMSALKDGYVKKLFFGIASDPEAQCLLEQYVFTFQHDENGKISLDVIQEDDSKKKRKTKGKKPTEDTIKKQVIKMIRHLCQVTTTLEPVPEEFYIFAKMEYVDSCPDDYLPEGFRPAEDEGGAYFDAKPFVLRMGGVVTPHHYMQMGCKSVLDSVDVKDEGGPFADDISRWQVTCDGTTHMDGGSLGEQEENVPAVSNGFATVPYSQKNLELHESEFFSQPVSMDMGAPTAPAPTQHQEMEAQLAMLQMAEGGKTPASKAAKKGGLLHPYKEAATPASAAGGLHSCPGTARTQSTTVRGPTRSKRGRGTHPDDDSEEDGEDHVKVFAETQISGDKTVTGRRKVAMVEKPIKQVKRQRRTRMGNMAA